MTPAASAQVTTTYTYDLQGQVTAAGRSVSTTTYGYDAARNRVAVGTVYPPPTGGNANLSVAFNGVDAQVALPVGGQVSGTNCVSPPAHGYYACVGTVAHYTPFTNYYGLDSFAYVATGPGGASAPATVFVTVAAPATPPAPTVANVSASAAYNTVVSIGLSPSGVYSALAVASGPTHGSASITGTTATYTPTSGYSGPDSFTFTATGPGGTSASATVSVTVQGAVNHEPVAVNDGYGMLQNETQDFYVLGNDGDSDGDALTITAVSNPVRTGGTTFGSVGSVTINGDHLTYTAPLVSKFSTGEFKNISFTYTITDGHGATSTATVNVSVEGS